MCGCRGGAGGYGIRPYVAEVGVLNDPAMLRWPQNKKPPAYHSAVTCGRFIMLGQYLIILSADTASEVRQLLSQKRR